MPAGLKQAALSPAPSAMKTASQTGSCCCASACAASACSLTRWRGVQPGLEQAQRLGLCPVQPIQETKQQAALCLGLLLCRLLQGGHCDGT